MGKGYVELQDLMSKQAKIPEEGDTDGWDKFYVNLGRPETPDKYELHIPEGMEHDKDFIVAVQGAAHKAGLNQSQWATIEDTYNRYLMESTKRHDERVGKLNEERWDKYKVEWAESKTVENIELAKRLFSDLAPSELKEIMTIDDVEKDPILVNLYSTIGRKLADDTLVKGEAPKSEGGSVPKFKESPEMYAAGDDEESKKARAYFEARGHVYK